jgi:dihydroxy-acid dehydratase
MDLFDNDITTRKVITKGAMENAVKVCQAISGSTNAVLHLVAIAHEAELDMNVLDAINALGKMTPQVARVNPAAKWNMEDFWMAGGIPRVMERLSPLFDVEALTVSGKTVRENLSFHRYSFPANEDIIKILEEPFEPSGGIAVLRGNLAPDTAISKPGAINPKNAALHR